MTDIPAGVQSRSNRIWRVSEVNTSLAAVDVGSVNVSFTIVDLGPVDPDHLRLIVDTDNDGLFADETAISGAISLGSNEYSFNGITSLVNNIRFTIGTSNSAQTPLPVELSYFSTEATEHSVELYWQTLVEKNVAGFEISRSHDGLAWRELAHVDATGAGNYKLSDRSPLAGRSYYKLTTTDFDLTKRTIGVRSVLTTSSIQLAAFPNPVSNSLTIRISDKETSLISVINQQGVDCSSNTVVTNREGGYIDLDFTRLPDGPYVINLKNAKSIHVIKK